MTLLLYFWYSCLSGQVGPEDYTVKYVNSAFAAVARLPTLRLEMVMSSLSSELSTMVAEDRERDFPFRRHLAPTPADGGDVEAHPGLDAAPQRPDRNSL